MWPEFVLYVVANHTMPCVYLSKGFAKDCVSIAFWFSTDNTLHHTIALGLKLCLEDVVL